MLLPRQSATLPCLAAMELDCWLMCLVGWQDQEHIGHRCRLPPVILPEFLLDLAPEGF